MLQLHPNLEKDRREKMLRAEARATFETTLKEMFADISEFKRMRLVDDCLRVWARIQVLSPEVFAQRFNSFVTEQVAVKTIQILCGFLGPVESFAIAVHRAVEHRWLTPERGNELLTNIGFVNVHMLKAELKEELRQKKAPILYRTRQRKQLHAP